MLSQFLNYLGGLGSGNGSAVNGDNAGPGIEAGGSPPSFWQSLGAATNRSSQAGGGIGGLLAALNFGGGQNLQNSNPGTASSVPNVPNTPTTASNSNQGSGLNWGTQPNGSQKGLSGALGGL